MKDNMNYEDRPMSVKEVKEFLGISKDKTYALFHQEDFPCIRFGRDMIIMKSDLYEWLKRHRYTNVDLVA